MDPIAQRTVEFYDAEYRNKGLNAQRLYPNEQLVQFVATHFFAVPHHERSKVRILEVGCGSGANLWMLAKEGFDTYGMDASATGVDLAKAHLRDKWGVTATIKVGLFDNLPFDDGYFDAVCDVVSLQHTTLAGTRSALAEIRRVLKSGGLFFSYRLSDASAMYRSKGGKGLDMVTVDNIADPSMPLHDNGPTSFWSPALAREIYEEQGLILGSVERYGRTYGSESIYVEYLGIVASKT